jgi:hypothetical protein
MGGAHVVTNYNLGPPFTAALFFRDRDIQRMAQIAKPSGCETDGFAFIPLKPCRAIPVDTRHGQGWEGRISFLRARSKLRSVDNSFDSLPGLR